LATKRKAAQTENDGKALLAHLAREGIFSSLEVLRKEFAKQLEDQTAAFNKQIDGQTAALKEDLRQKIVAVEAKQEQTAQIAASVAESQQKVVIEMKQVVAAVAETQQKANDMKQSVDKISRAITGGDRPERGLRSKVMTLEKTVRRAQNTAARKNKRVWRVVWILLSALAFVFCGIIQQMITGRLVAK
jgi:hypothetical protein